MNPEIKAEWLKRLRSGEIPQGIGRLARDVERCCHGVICDIAVEQKVIEVTYGEDGITYEGSISIPPHQVDDWADSPLSRNLSFKDRMDGSLSLAYLNDQGLTFNQIADVIEWEF
jgi:hypothetical protein